MKKGTGAAIILFTLVLGQILSVSLPVKIPGAIYGMILLLIALTTGIIKAESVEETADLLIGNMLVMFIPGGVRLMKVYREVAEDLIPLIFVVVVTTFITLGVTAGVTDFFIEKMSGEEELQ